DSAGHEQRQNAAPTGKGRAECEERGARRPVRGDSSGGAAADRRARANFDEGPGESRSGRSAERFVQQSGSVTEDASASEKEGKGGLHDQLCRGALQAASADAALVRTGRAAEAVAVAGKHAD